MVAEAQRKQSKLIYFLYVFLLLSPSACIKIDNENNREFEFALSGNAKQAYESETPLILYAYRNEVVQSEAYVDWEAYINDFKQEVGKNYFYKKVNSEEFQSIASGATEFTLFVKKGYPVFLYEGLVVEPQVYTAINRQFSNQPLRNVDRAFMPEEIK